MQTRPIDGIPAEGTLAFGNGLMVRFRADAVYTKSKIDIWARPLAHFEPLTPIGEQFDEIDEADLAEDQKETQMNTLYQTNEEKPRFGTYLAKNSSGQIVLEMKDGGVEAFDPKTIEEVMPYTVAVQQTTGNSRVHIEIAKGDLAKDDLLISASDGNLYRVVQLDTKSKRAVPADGYKFRKLVTTALGASDEDDQV